MSIKAVDLNYVYSGGTAFEQHALFDVNFEIQDGEFVGLIGHTGSGKSTLTQHLNGLLRASSGALYYNGENIYDPGYDMKGLRSKVGLVFQFSEYQLFEETILKDVAFGPKNFGASEEEALQKAKEALSQVMIPASFYERSPLNLSGGQKRRVAIAGILAMDPKVIVLDEPTAGLDPKGASEMMAIFKKLNQELNKTIILVTHDNELVYDFSDEVVLLDKGRVIAHKTCEDFFNDRELMKENKIVLPKIVELRTRLEERGFMNLEGAKDIKTLVKRILS